jgi:hypothetical protein
MVTELEKAPSKTYLNFSFALKRTVNKKLGKELVMSTFFSYFNLSGEASKIYEFNPNQCN